MQTTVPRPESGLARYIKEPYCGLSHAGGAIASLVGMILLLVLTTGGAFSYVSLSIYGVALVMLFTASALAHSLHVNDSTGDRLDRLDYAAIFFLIAGTYTPVCLTALRGPWGYTMLSIEWAFAIVGACTVLLTKISKKYVSPLYVPMGWLVLVAVVPMLRLMPLSAFVWLFAGGVIFTLGAVIFITERPASGPAASAGMTSGTRWCWPARGVILLPCRRSRSKSLYLDVLCFVDLGIALAVSEKPKQRNTKEPNTKQPPRNLHRFVSRDGCQTGEPLLGCRLL
ncbi:MAG: hemolysin III family protein [Tepidisphaeraceae bacterium]